MTQERQCTCPIAIVQRPFCNAIAVRHSQATEPVECGGALFRDGRGRTKFDDGDLAQSISVYAIEPSPQPTVSDNN